MVIVVTSMGPGQARAGARIVESSLRGGGGTGRRSDRRLRSELEFEWTHAAAPLLAAADGDPEQRDGSAGGPRARGGALVLGEEGGGGGRSQGKEAAAGTRGVEGVCEAMAESAGAGLRPAQLDRAATRCGGCGTARRSSPGLRSLWRASQVPCPCEAMGSERAGTAPGLGDEPGGRGWCRIVCVRWDLYRRWRCL